MKTLANTLKPVAVAAVAAVAILGLRAFAQTGTPAPQFSPPEQPPKDSYEYTLRIEKGVKIKAGKEGEFLAALRKFPANKYNKILHTPTNAGSPPHEIAVPPPANEPTPPPSASAGSARLKIQQVTESDALRALQADELTPIGSNVTYQVTTSSSTTMSSLLTTLE